MSSTNINRANLENISPFRRDSSTVMNMNQSQRIINHSSHKKISSTSRGQLSHRCNSSSTSNNNTFANSSLNLHYNINTSVSNNNNISNQTSQSNNNENILSSSLLRTSIANHKQISSGIGGSNFANSYSNINITGTNPHQNSLSNSSYSKALTSIDICADSSSKNSQNVSVSASHNGKLQHHQQIQQQQPSLTQLKQNAIKKYCLQQQQQFQQTQQQQNQYTNQVPPYHFEKGVSKTHRGHTSSYNNFSYIQQQQNSSVSNILGNSQKQNMNMNQNSNWNQATPPNKRVNTMPSSGTQQLQSSQLNLQTNNLNGVNDENAILALSSSINISTYKVSPRLLKTQSNTSSHQQQVNNFLQNSQLNNNSTSNNSNQQQNQTSTNSNQSNSNQSNYNNSNQVILSQSSQNISLKKVYSQDEQVKQGPSEEEQAYLEKLKKEIDSYKQREVQYLTRISSLESDNKTINESVLKQETNIKVLKKELVKCQQQSANILNSTNSGGSQQQNNNPEVQQQQQTSTNQTNSNNVNAQLQQKQIAMLESYVETLSKKLQQLELEQIRQQNQNPQSVMEKQYSIQKNKYKQLVEKYFTLEKLFNQITSENDYYKVTLNQLKAEYALKNQQNQTHCHQKQQPHDQVQSSVLKALQLAQMVKQ